MCGWGAVPIDVMCGAVLQSDPYITSDRLIYQLVQTVACNG